MNESRHFSLPKRFSSTEGDIRPQEHAPSPLGAVRRFAAQWLPSLRQNTTKDTQVLINTINTRVLQTASESHTITESVKSADQESRRTAEEQLTNAFEATLSRLESLPRPTSYEEFVRRAGLFRTLTNLSFDGAIDQNKLRKEGAEMVKFGPLTALLFLQEALQGLDTRSLTPENRLQKENKVHARIHELLSGYRQNTNQLTVALSQEIALRASYLDEGQIEELFTTALARAHEATTHEQVAVPHHNSENWLKKRPAFTSFIKTRIGQKTT